MKKSIKYLALLMLFVGLFFSCSKSGDVDTNINIYVPSNTILGQAEVNASSSQYAYTEYYVGNAEPSHYYKWEVTSGELISTQGISSIWVVLKAPKPGTFTDVKIKVTISDNKKNVINTLEKTIKVK